MFSRLSFVLFVLLFVNGINGTTVKPPGQIFDLTNWKLELPISGSQGGISTITQPTLHNYTSAYFYTDVSQYNGSMTFWCPDNGVTTNGSSFPRSELREVPPGGEWNLTGTHLMNGTVSISQLPENGKIVIAQIHIDGVTGSCSVILELEMASQSLIAHSRDVNCKDVQHTVGTYALGKKIAYQVKFVSGVLTVSTDQLLSATQNYTTYSWAHKPLYFKAGDYVQDNTTSSTKGGIVHYWALSVSHHY